MNITKFVKDLRIELTREQVVKWLRKPHLWLAIIILVLATIPQYSENLGIPKEFFPWRWIPFERYTLERIFFLLPIGYSAITVGIRTGIALTGISFACMLPRAVLSSPAEPIDTLFEALLVAALGIFFCLFRKIQIDMREQKEHDLEVVRKMQENQRFYIRQAVIAQEEERKRISRELHDDTVQVLGGLSRKLDNFIRKNTTLSEQDVDFLKQLHESLNVGLTEVQRFSQDLRPSLLDFLGLLTALRSLVHKAEEHYDLAIGFEVVGDERRFRPELEILIFRIVQEALSNIGRHANASSAEVKIEFFIKKTIFTISDNGDGFDLPESVDDLPRSGRLGLAGIHERAQLLDGLFNVSSTKGRGTTITIEMPH
ncbi:sensor histidine kinase [Chloroflexota bacterium]